MLASFEGDRSSFDTWNALSDEDSYAFLIDVRTCAEWAFVGIPDLSVLSLSKELWKVEWKIFPSMVGNKDFLNVVGDKISSHLQNTDVHCTKILDLYFICRSGCRSLEAAIAVVDYFCNRHTSDEGDSIRVRTYNVGSGFEGRIDSHGHRSQIEGWKFDGLPWVQK